MSHIYHTQKSTKLFGIAIILVALLSIASSTIFNRATAVGSASFNLTPSNASQAQGNQFSVTINENGGNAPITAVEANLTYDPNKLQYIGIDAAGSAFTESIGGAGSNGSVQIVRFRKAGDAGVTNNQLVAKVTFKALASTGNTAINIASSSHILGSNASSDLWNGAATSTPISFTNATSTPTPAPASSQTSLEPREVGNNTQSSTNTNNSITSGSSNKTNTNNSTSSSQPSQENTMPLAISTTGEQLGGGLVAVTVSKANGSPASNVTVMLDQQSAVTDESGVACFVGVVAGSYTVKVSNEGAVVTQQVEVKNDSNVQEFRVTLAKKTSLGLFIFPVVVLLIVLTSFVLYKQRRSKRSTNFDKTQTDGIVAHSSQGNTNAEAPTENSPEAGSVITPGSDTTQPPPSP